MANTASIKIAVVTSGDTQHVVAIGSDIDVPLRQEAVGERVKLDDLLAGQSVSAIITKHGRHPKISGRLFHNKVRHSRFPHGHKQSFTKLTIQDIQ